MTPSRRRSTFTVEKLRDRLFEPVGSNFPDPPDLLYHYTTSSGVLGIVTQKKLWASNLLFMNDSSELENGTQIFDNAIRNAERTGLLDDDGEPFSDWYINGPAFNISFGIFGVCFSELGDDLSQWRAYGQAGGYSLGFSGPELQAMHSRGIATLDKVIYDEPKKVSIAETTVSAAIDEWRTLKAGPATTMKRRNDIFREVLEHAIRHCICIMKHHSFAAEREWRLFVANAELDDETRVRYRVGHSSLIPYLEIPIVARGRRILRKVITGPNAQQSLAHSGVMGCLIDNRMAHVDFDLSTIPYRV